MEKQLSICVPTYNMEALLERCLDSFVIETTNIDWLEIIIVNDGSKDNSSVIAHKYQERYPDTFLVIDKPNGNYGSCVNTALKVAKGVYFKICDADDMYYKDNIPGFIDFLKQSDADIVFSPYHSFNYDGSLANHQDFAIANESNFMTIANIDWQDKCYLPYRSMHSICVRTDILRKNGYKQTEGISYTDTEFVFYSVLYSETCVFFNKPIYKYFLGRDGQTMSIESMTRSHIHFYQNARVMLDSFMALPTSVSINKRIFLFECIRSCFFYFANIVIGFVNRPKNQIELIKELLYDASYCNVPYPLDKPYSSCLAYILWRRYHIPQPLIYNVMRFYKYIKKIVQYKNS